MDFTVSTYESLLKALKGRNAGFYGFAGIVSGEVKAYTVLRHDVDRKPENALVLAKAEAAAGIRASYHFRMGRNMNQEGIIREIASLGHEIAYHYEDLSAVYGPSALKPGPRNEEKTRLAYERFRTNLEDLRRLADVNVISMHGSPLSATDNRQLWKYFDYHGEGIVCEPYFDIDVSNVLYLTDTGRRWDGDRSNIRDRGFSADSSRVNGRYGEWKVRPVQGSMMNMTEEGLFLRSRFRIRRTSDLIALAGNGSLPDRLIINTHPQRWTGSVMPWITEYLTQNIKNQIKRMI